MGKYFRVGDFANRAGISIRTLRYYDQIGLLEPSAHSESGQRLYTELDYARLQQILTLKLIGLSLEEIRQLLTTDIAGIEHLLERQKQALEQQARQLLQVVQTIEHAQNAIRAAHELDLETLINIIRMVNMYTQSDWLSQFVDAKGQAALAARDQHLSLHDHKQAGLAWKTLFEDIQQHMDKDFHDPAIKHLIARWDDLMAQFASGDPEFAARLNAAYTDLDHAPDVDNAPPELQAWVRDLRDAAAFIQRARAE
ncbi:MAG: MerR family transcriptional regulator [Anaerolineae bacterium]|nr:MerR family transcriptional regulator [Anaerolineae bacterium]